MLERLLREILQRINKLNERIDCLDALLLELKISEDDPNEDERRIITEYEETKKKDKIHFTKFL